MSETLHFSVNDQAIKELIQADEILTGLIGLIGDISIPLKANYFQSLVQSIIGQQLSAKAANTIHQRFLNLAEDFSPESILRIDPELMRSAGLSRAKVQYIQDLCSKIISDDIQLHDMDQLEDEQIVRMLKKVKGIGPWTSEMFLIFSVGRVNVLSIGDAGLQRAVKWLFEMEDRPDGKYLEQHAERWNPYRTIASLYLWKAIDQGYVDSGRSIGELIGDGT